MPSRTKRPRVICHMAASTDGRIVVDGWPDAVATAVRREYEQVHAEYGADGWLCGRVTMEPFAGATRPDAEVAREQAGGTGDVDLAGALEKIGERFGVQTLMLEGGGRINGALLAAGLVDEVSLLVAPVADGRLGTPALFDLEGGAVPPRRLVLEAVERRADDVVRLHYRVEGSAGSGV